MNTDARPNARPPLFDRFFSYIDAQKPSDRAIFGILLVVFVSALACAVIAFFRAEAISIPSEGGIFIEGIAGTPRFVNPSLALSRTDEDMVALLYSGLMQVGESGELVPDLAESVTVSDDGLVYNAVLKEGVTFHDGTPIRAADLAYTVSLIQDPSLKSPLRGNFAGVTVEVLGERELNFILEEPYAPFMENLTLGIMPEHVWSTLAIEAMPFSQHNTEPVGSGPYRIAGVSRDDAGLIGGYTLRRHTDSRVSPKIGTIQVKFYPDEDALLAAFERGEVHGASGFSYDSLQEIESEDGLTVIEEPLPRVFSVFFNQNKSAVLRDPAAREALAAAVDRSEIIESVLLGYGAEAHSPIPPGFGAGDDALAATAAQSAAVAAVDIARNILADGGWTQNEDGNWTKEIDGSETVLGFTLTTANSAVFEKTAYELERMWKDLGVQVAVELYEESDLVQTVIRPREYEALLFGAEIGRALDLYPFWHSSERDDPGLNVALYANSRTDTLLHTARTTASSTVRAESIRGFEAEILAETPAIFLFSPSFAYVTQGSVVTAAMEGIARPSERFANVEEWYMNTENVWPFFAR